MRTIKHVSLKFGEDYSRKKQTELLGANTTLQENIDKNNRINI